MDYPNPSRWPTLLIGLALGSAVGAGALWYVTRDGNDTSAVDTAVAQTTAVSAEQRDLVSFVEWPGTLSSGAPATIAASSRGTITRNSSVGDTIEMGDVIAEIDGQPVVALYGSVPQFREISITTEDGADIRQLETNLVALGFDPDGTITVDENFTNNTSTMVERWEESLGFESPDGVVPLGQVAFIDGRTKVTNVTAVGSQAAAGQPLLATETSATSGFVYVPTTGTTLIDLLSIGDVLEEGQSLGLLDELPIEAVTVDADPDRPDANEVMVPAGATIVDVFTQLDTFIEVGRPLYRYEIAEGAIELAVAVADSDMFSAGAIVDVELPDETIVPGVVSDVSVVARTVQTGQTTETVVDITIEALEPLGDSFTAGPVTVRTDDDAILGALLIPVRSLIALAEGGHAVEIEGRGLVAVELGVFDDGWVEVTNGAISLEDSLLAPL